MGKDPEVSELPWGGRWNFIHGREGLIHETSSDSLLRDPLSGSRRVGGGSRGAKRPGAAEAARGGDRVVFPATDFRALSQLFLSALHQPTGPLLSLCGQAAGLLRLLGHLPHHRLRSLHLDGDPSPGAAVRQPHVQGHERLASAVRPRDCRARQLGRTGLQRHSGRWANRALHPSHLVEGGLQRPAPGCVHAGP